MDSPIHFRSAPDCVSCPFGEGVAILDLRSNVYFSLNAVGAEVWRRLDRPVAAHELVAHVAERFEVAPEVCAPDIGVLLDALAGHGLIEQA